MRISGLGNVPTIQSRQPSQDRPVIREASAKEGAERVKSSVQTPKVDASEDVGHGQVDAYRALEHHAPVERRPEASFSRLDINNDGALTAAELEANSASINEVLNRRVSPEQLLRELDVDEDGRLAQAELQGLESNGNAPSAPTFTATV